MNRRHFLLCALALGTIALPLAFAADAPPAHEPRVLVIGDSISIGYTPFVKEMMKGKAYVEHPKDNCAATVVGLKKLDMWLGSQKWDVIHFNWGLHDLKYIKDDKGTIGAAGSGKQWVPAEEYEKNLDELVTRLENESTNVADFHFPPEPVESGQIMT